MADKKALERHRIAKERLMASLEPGWREKRTRPEVYVEPSPGRAPGKVNVAILSYMLAGVGGIEIWAGMLAKRLAMDPRIHVVGFGAGIETPGPCNRAVRESCPVAIGYAGMASLASHADVVIASSRLDWPALKLKPRQRVIWVSHGDCRWTHEAAEAAEPYAHQYVAVHIASLDAVPESRREDALIIENAVDPYRLDPSGTRDGLRAKFGWDSPTLLFVGRLSPEKRPAIAVEALPHLPGWKLAVAGAGPEHRTVTKKASELGVRGRLLMLGAREDVGDLLHAADVLILPSDVEGFALAAAEAMWAGLPVVASEVGVFRTRPDLGTVLPVHGAKPEEWAAAIREARSGPGRTAKAQQYARTELSPVAWGRAWADLAVATAPPPQESKPMPKSVGGPGTELAKLIGGIDRLLGPLRSLLGAISPALKESLDLKSTVGCGCKTRLQKMDEWGVAGCQENIAIIVGWLKESAEAKGLPVADYPVRLLVDRAIARASKRPR